MSVLAIAFVENQTPFIRTLMNHSHGPGQSKERSILVSLLTLISLILVHATAWGQQQVQNQQQDRSEQSQEVLGDTPPQPAPLAVPRPK